MPPWTCTFSAVANTEASVQHTVASAAAMPELSLPSTKVAAPHCAAERAASMR